MLDSFLYSDQSDDDDDDPKLLMKERLSNSGSSGVFSDDHDNISLSPTSIPTSSRILKRSPAHPLPNGDLPIAIPPPAEYASPTHSDAGSDDSTVSSLLGGVEDDELMMIDSDREKELLELDLDETTGELFPPELAMCNVAAVAEAVCKEEQDQKRKPKLSGSVVVSPKFLPPPAAYMDIEDEPMLRVNRKRSMSVGMDDVATFTHNDNTDAPDVEVKRRKVEKRMAKESGWSTQPASEKSEATKVMLPPLVPLTVDDTKNNNSEKKGGSSPTSTVDSTAKWSSDGSVKRGSPAFDPHKETTVTELNAIDWTFGHTEYTCTAHAKAAYFSMCSWEHSRRLPRGLMGRQRDLGGVEKGVELRAETLVSMFRFGKEKNIDKLTCHLAALILDHVLAVRRLGSPDRLRDAAAAALVLATKVEEYHHLRFSSVRAPALAASESIADLVNMERVILQALDFSLDLPTPIFYANFLHAQCNSSIKQIRITNYLLDLCVLDASFRDCAGTRVAHAAVVLAITLDTCHHREQTEPFEDVLAAETLLMAETKVAAPSFIRAGNTRDVMYLMMQLYEKAVSWEPARDVYVEYSTAEEEHVAQIDIPDGLMEELHKE